MFEVQVEGNFTLYYDMCLRYSVKEMLHFTMMCVWGTEWVKCYCIQWCAYLSYKARKILLCSMMCVWDTLRGKCYSLQWCVWFTGWENFYSIELYVSEVEGEGNFTVYIDVSEVQGEWIISFNIDVSQRYRVREMLLFTIRCDWCTGWGNVTV